MQIDWWTLGLQTVNALVLIWLLAHFLFHPVVDAITTRQKAAGQLLADAQAAKATAQSEREKRRFRGRRFGLGSFQGLAAVLDKVGSLSCRLLSEAQADADKLRVAAKAEIEAERHTEALAAEDRAGRLAIDIATKLLDRLPQEVRVAAFIDGIATGLAQLPEGTRTSLGTGGAAIRLTTARAVTPQEVETCRKALAGVLGHPVLVEVSVDPELIAGIELEAPHAVVRNSFRADLVRLRSELVHHHTNAA